MGLTASILCGMMQGPLGILFIALAIPHNFFSLADVFEIQSVVNHLTIEAEIEAAAAVVCTFGISQPCLVPIDCDTENWSLDLLTKTFVNRDR